jgi:hypothetical protein
VKVIGQATPDFVDHIDQQIDFRGKLYIDVGNLILSRWLDSRDEISGLV